MAEREGFEPSVGVAYTRFPSVRLQPLGHLSVFDCYIQGEMKKGTRYQPLLTPLDKGEPGNARWKF